ncbi:hypothetical protein LCGC14_0912140 [marine sediment metagenome]|uniref:Uncharacterized protein n=1 Tax=marine sediment metagenome TaxID=412755 RepID=A0A0F9PE06_9ZZZZ
MALYESLLTVGILFGIFVLGYLRMTKKTLMEAITELRGALSGRTEDLDLKW